MTPSAVADLSSGSVTIVADLLFDGSGGPPLEDPVVTVEGGRIRDVRQRPQRWSQPTEEVHDFRGCTIVPGLIDPHCHLALDPTLAAEDSIAFATGASETEIVSLMERNARLAAASGITTLRDCGSPGHVGVAMRQIALRSGGAHPRLLVSGRPITTPLGHCHWMGLAAESGEELREAVATLAEEGVDFIKVMATGGMMTHTSDPFSAQYTSAQLTELVSEARRRNRRVAAHALCAAGVRAALAAGVNTLEHCVSTQGAPQDHDPSLDAAIADAGIIVGLTAHGPMRELLRAGDTKTIRERLAPHRRMLEAGVELTVHSDGGTPGSHFDAFAESIEIFRLGLDTSTAEAVRAATSSAAAALGIEDQTGLLAAGMRADLAVLDGDLGTDIRALRRVVAVAQEGQMNRPRERQA
jgi:imidazolonepropionase-like amidohydrolase